MATEEELRALALKVAQACIEDWAHESWYELNEVYGVELTEDEMLEVARLAGTAVVSIP